MSGMLHKVKEAVTGHHDSTSDTTHSNTTNNANYAENPKSSNHGPHGSAIANKLDPRVDSDRGKSPLAPEPGSLNMEY